ncbi:hypothetical protein RDWZM_008668 [Blomia tropicalis]|uniref:Uncharacterized protein n=1 Tax=Blomia tropicalis TaxID=40697 RepID=A0A9Q0RLM7_BLOTA|nr:enolase-phosphatase E1 [Blomia tropicalis]KAJ6217511.1 hypothetical protein RDWZM_008668 [Blomia tropicalis]
MATSSSTLTGLYVPPGPKYFPRPRMIVYRFLDVIKQKHNLVVEILTYVRANLYPFLQKYWDRPELMSMIDGLRNESCDDSQVNDNAPPIVPARQTPSAIQDSVVLYVAWKCMREHNRLDLGHDSTNLQNLVHWVLLDGIITDQWVVSIDRAFIDTFEHFSLNRVPQLLLSTVTHQLFDTCRLLSKTNHGDLTRFLNFLDVPMDTRSKNTYAFIATQFNMASSDILFIAFSDTECKKAARAGFRVAKIKQRNQPVPRMKLITVVNDLSEVRIA